MEATKAIPGVPDLLKQAISDWATQAAEVGCCVAIVVAPTRQMLCAQNDEYVDFHSCLSAPRGVDKDFAVMAAEALAEYAGLQLQPVGMQPNEEQNSQRSQRSQRKQTRRGWTYRPSAG